jgi:hypothetical protein
VFPGARLGRHVSRLYAAPQAARQHHHRMPPSYSVYHPVGTTHRALCGAQQRDWVCHSAKDPIHWHFLMVCYLRPKAQRSAPHSSFGTCLELIHCDVSPPQAIRQSTLTDCFDLMALVMRGVGCTGLVQACGAAWSWSCSMEYMSSAVDKRYRYCMLHQSAHKREPCRRPAG